jgi:hypothetical protein
MKPSIGQLRELINENYSLISILKKANPSGVYHTGGTCFCPFHDNTDTPSASIYDDEGGEKLYCFSERKLYSASDAMEKLLDLDVYEIGSRLFEKMSHEEQDVWLEKHGGSIDYLDEFSYNNKEVDEEKVLNRAKLKNLFRYGKISLTELLKSWR